MLYRIEARRLGGGADQGLDQAGNSAAQVEGLLYREIIILLDMAH